MYVRMTLSVLVSPEAAPDSRNWLQPGICAYLYNRLLNEQIRPNRDILKIGLRPRDFEARRSALDCGLITLNSPAHFSASDGIAL